VYRYIKKFLTEIYAVHKAQRLAGPITTYEKLISAAQHHRLYIIMKKVADTYEAKGILKTGEKRIFHLVC
jgi:hypothetical protein